MRKYLSYFMLLARCSVYRLLAVLLSMAAVEFGMFYYAMQMTLAQIGMDSQQPLGFEGVLKNSYAVFVFAVAFCLFVLFLADIFASKKSRNDYTLGRLQLSKPCIIAMQTLYNFLCFGMLMAAQALLLYGMFCLYTTMAPAGLVSGQTFFLACFRSNFVAAVIPLSNPLRITRNIVLMVSYAFVLAVLCHFDPQQKKKYNLLSFFLTMTMLWFVRDYDGYLYDITLLLTAIFVGIGGTLWKLFMGEDDDEQQTL